MPEVSKFPQSYVSGTLWSNPDNAFAADENDAVVLLNGAILGRSVDYYNWGFDLDNNATINQVDVEVKWYATQETDETTFTVWKRKGSGSPSTVFSRTDEPQSYVTTVTSLSSGQMPTVSELNDDSSDGMRIGLYAQMAEESWMHYRVDYVKVTVDYNDNYEESFDVSYEYECLFDKGTVFSRAFAVAYEYGAGLAKQMGKVLTAGTVFASVLTQKFFAEHVYPKIEITEYPIEIALTDYPIQIEVIMMPTSGSTVEIQATFPSAAGDLSSLTDVEAKVYDKGGNELDDITMTEESTGIYKGEYTIPNAQRGIMTVEVSGELGDKTIITRKMFESVWRG